MSPRPDGNNVTTQEIAAEVLALAEREGISLKTALSKLVSGLDYKVRGSIHAYVFETVKRLNAIDHMLSLCLRISLNELEPFTRNLLRIATYEMKYKGVHPALATDSAVRIAKKRGKAVRLMNAVLRCVENVEIDYTKMDEIKKLSLKYFHPEWFVRYTVDLLGKKEAIELMKANLQPQRIYVRVNELKASIEGVTRYLEEKGVTVEETFMDEVLAVTSYSKHPAALEGHREGKYVLQDLASCFVSHVINPSPDDIVLDLAAAPGMKTSHMAMLMENRGRIIAIDNSPERLERMRAKMKTLGVENVEYILGDGCRVVAKADKALVDAPCSSTGSYAIHPNVKWTFDENKFRATLSVQRKMLKNALTNAEEVVYATCSLMFEENELNVLRTGAKVVRIKTPFGRGIARFRNWKFGEWGKVVRSYPHLHKTAGFFIAKLRRV